MANCVKRSGCGPADSEKLVSFRGGSGGGVGENEQQ